MINDASSGVGAIVEQTRLHGVVKGTPTGEVALVHIMADEKIAEGESLVTSGGDRIFPKGLPIGTVSQVSPGPDLFLNIRLKPAANLSRLEEVLVITEIQVQDVESAESQTPVRASDILAQRLPSVPKKPPATSPQQQKSAQGQNAARQSPAATVKPGAAPAAARESTGSAPDTINRVAPKPNGSPNRIAKPKTEAVPPAEQPDTATEPNPDVAVPDSGITPAKPPADQQQPGSPDQPEQPR
jgi:rod shape-determining protein MreC